MPDCAPTFEQREFLSWYQLNAYFCPEREVPLSPCKSALPPLIKWRMNEVGENLSQSRIIDMLRIDISTVDTLSMLKSYHRHMYLH